MVYTYINTHNTQYYNTLKEYYLQKKPAFSMDHSNVRCLTYDAGSEKSKSMINTGTVYTQKLETKINNAGVGTDKFSKIQLQNHCNRSIT
jgi:hypothetical protein